jgi:hypothetical protein
MRNAYNIPVNGRGRLEERCGKEKTKLGLKGIGVDWTELSQGRVQWLVLVNSKQSGFINGTHFLG